MKAGSPCMVLQRVVPYDWYSAEAEVNIKSIFAYTWLFRCGRASATQSLLPSALSERSREKRALKPGSTCIMGRS